MGENTEEIKVPEEDHVEGCHRENYMVPHICPVATGGWCRDYVKCKSLEGKNALEQKITI